MSVPGAEKNLFLHSDLLSEKLCSIGTPSHTYLMRSCVELSAPCSCLTVVAAEAMLTEVGTETVTGGDGPAVTAVPAPGSVFTVAAE